MLGVDDTARRYAGVLPDRHVRAVARAALRAHGFEPCAPGALAAARGWIPLGLALRDALPVALRERAEQRPELWRRLPAMLALGHEQAEVLRACGAPDADGADLRALGAAFNAAIAMLDWVVDESAAGPELFARLTDGCIGAIFTDPDGGSHALAAASSPAGDPVAELVVALVGDCAARGAAIHREGGDDAAWARTGERVLGLLEAERRLAAGDGLDDEETRVALLERKSAGPTLVLLDLVDLLAGPEVSMPPALVRAAARLGRVFVLVDDLTDLALDGRRGAGNTLLLRHGAPGAQSDAALAAIADAGACELAGLLAELRDDARHVRVARFAEAVVAAWLGDPAGEALPVAAPRVAAPRLLEARAAEAALALLVAEQQCGFAEAHHHLCFPRGEVGDVRYETHPAQLSFRAVALDALLDARDAGLRVPGGTIEREVLLLLRAKHAGVRGGWSYFQDVPELPPDADDLGQVLQALARAGGRDLAATCDEPVRMALDARDPSGGIPTWILDPLAPGELDRRIQRYLDVMGGVGVHPEVVANLLAGLLLADPDRYATCLADGLAYLDAVQEPGGWWESKWYAGPFYGTFKAAVIVGALAPSGTTAYRARDFIRDSQQRDGGWGDPLATAHALLAAAALGDTGADLELGLARLAAEQEQDGGWPAVAWIQFPTTDGLQTHASRTMTTAFALKACLAAGAVVQGVAVPARNLVASWR